MEIDSDAIQLFKYKFQSFLSGQTRFMFNFEWFNFILNFTKKLDIVAKFFLHYLNLIL